MVKLTGNKPRFISSEELAAKDSLNNCLNDSLKKSNNAPINNKGDFEAGNESRKYLGTIIGKSKTSGFEFIADSRARKFDFCKVFHKDYGYVLCQIIELEKTSSRVVAKAIVLGYKGKDKNIRQIRAPFDINSKVEPAEESFISSIIRLDDERKGAYIGLLENTSLKVHLDLNKLLTKHIAVLAKSGSGKSYSVGVLLEEIMDRNVPLLIIDPHGEYESLCYENDNKRELELMKRFSVKPKAYKRKIKIYGDFKLNPEYKPIRIDEKLSPEELIEIMPTKLTSSQLGLLYSALKEIDSITFDNLIYSLQIQENNLKWNVINVLEYLKNLEIFSSQPTSLNELIQPGKCSIICLKGFLPEIQEILLYKLLRDLFKARKENKIAPFFLVIEEAHNFVPEKGFSDAKCSKIIKTIASEGRKFGLGLCIVSQRPAIVQKTVLSQCTTQIILKITNPNDLKAVIGSVEGISQETGQELRSLAIGTALVAGITELPLFVSIRPRKTRHGGEAVDILGSVEPEDKFFESIKEFKKKKLLPIIKPRLTKKDIMLMHENIKIKTVLIPCYMFLCSARGQDYNLLIEMANGSIVRDIEDFKVHCSFLPELDKLTHEQTSALKAAFKLKEFSFEEFISKTGFPLSSKEDLSFLAEKGYLVFSGGSYRIGDKYVLSELRNYAFYTKISYSDISYDIMLKKRARLDSVKAKLSKFTQIKDFRECFLVHYSIEDANEDKENQEENQERTK